MRFLALPAWQAQGLFLLTLGAIVLLYILKPPRRRTLVPSNLLWTRLLEETRRRSDRWRWWLSLLLALVIALSIALALARPEWGASGAGRKVAIIVDNSRTMAAGTSDGRSRFDHARAKASALIESVGAEAEILIADTCGQVGSYAFRDHRTARETLDRIEVARTREPFFPKFPEESAEVFFVTDGVGVRDVAENVERVSVFEPATNVGITAFEVRPVPREPHRFEAFVEILNASDAPVPVELHVSGTAGHRLRHPVTLAPGEPFRKTFDLSAFEGGAVRAAVTSANDDLEADNTAYAYLPLKRSLRVSAVGPGSRYLQTFLALDPRIELTLLRPEDWDRRAKADLYVFDRFAPESPPESPVLLFRPQSVSWIPPLRSEIQNPEVREWDRAHPLLRWVSLEDLIVHRATPMDAGELQPVVGSREAPLIVVGETPVPWIHVAFDLDASNFPLQASFPIFFSNAVNWLTGGQLALSKKVGRVEVPFEDARVTDLEDRVIATVRVLGETSFEADEPGIYTASRGERKVHVAVNLTDRGATEVNRSSAPEPKEIPPPSRRAGLDLSVVLAGVALALAALEFWTYHRRVTL